MITDIPDMSSIVLYSRETEALWVNVWAEIKDGRLIVSGQDLGGVVEEWFGNDEFEYQCTFDESNTRKLLSILSEDSSDPIATLKERFSGSRGFWELKEFCDEANISYEYFSWHSHD